MKRNKSILVSVMLFIAAIGFSALKVQEAVYLEESYDTVSIRFTKESITKNDFKEALEREKANGTGAVLKAAAWQQLNGENVENKDLNRIVKIPVLLVTGDMALTAPMALAIGSYAYQDDEYGCVIDIDTAYALYGTKKAVGNVLTCQNRNYYVRGVVKAKRPLLLIQNSDHTVQYTNLELFFQNREQGDMQAEEFLLKNNFPTDYVLIDGCFYANLLHTFLVLPIWLFLILLGLGIMLYLRKKKHEFRRSRLILYHSINLLTVTGYGILLYQFAGSPIRIPEKLIPTKCSDFDFWSRQYHSVMEQLQKMRYLAPNLRDVTLENEMLKLFLNVTVMVLLYAAFLIHMRSGKDRE